MKSKTDHQSDEREPLACVDAEQSAVENAIDDPAIPEAFAVRDESSANWLIRKILESRAYVKTCCEWFEREQNRARRTEEFFTMRYGQQLLEFAKSKIAAAGGKRKSVSLPAGTIGFRSEPDKLIVDDEKAVIAWAKQHNPALISMIEKLSKSALNEHFENTGELPDAGTHIEPAREKFYVK